MPLVGTVDRTLVPGAPFQTSLPKFEKDARLSVSLVAEMPSAPGQPAGYDGLEDDELPAAAMTITP